MKMDLKVLKEAVNANGAVLVKRDGTLIMKDLPENIHAETFSIMCATIYGAAITANSNLKSNLNKIEIEGEAGSLLILPVNDKKLLALYSNSKIDADNDLQYLE